MKLRTPLLLLIVAVLLPTACLLWLMIAAVRNVRATVGQSVDNVDLDRLNVTRDSLNAAWREQMAALERLPEGAAAFPEIVRRKLADSAVILDASGAPLYPAPMRLPSPDPTVDDPRWIKARLLENTAPAAAAAAYEAIGHEAQATSTEAARAYQGAARCLMKAGDREAAVKLVFDRFSGPAFAPATDLQGRRIRPDLLLLVIASAKPGDPLLIPAARNLRAAVLDYGGNPPMPLQQRVFLIHEMLARKLPADLLDFPTLRAEEIAATFLEYRPPIMADASLQPGWGSGIWQFGLAKAHLIVLFRDATIQQRMREMIAAQKLPPDIRITALPPGAKVPDAALHADAGRAFPGWQLAVAHTGPNPLEDLAARQMALYVWTGSLVAVLIVLLTVLALRATARSLRLAGMKADLVATVSHELKTPLASMQLLVDTLLEDERIDPVKTREYLELIGRENVRLSRLIGNFLTFSRLERNKYSFDFTAVRVDDVVRAAVAAAGERFSQPDCRLTVNVERGLPEIRADEGALATALVNLLDNAYKYTPGEKQIELRAYAQAHGVCLEVRDNGIGIAPGEIKRIFREFHQADQRLSRAGGGCGLGLAIVRHLVEAHGGRVDVTSEIGKGSTFSVALRTA